MARRYDSKEAKRRILTACVRLFLEKGYTNTKVAEILKEADVSAGSFQNIFRTKDGVLTELIGMMFSRQFGAVRPLAANAPSPVYLYAVETALQLAMTELSENLRDIAGYLCGSVHLPRHGGDHPPQHHGRAAGGVQRVSARVRRV